MTTPVDTPDTVPLTADVYRYTIAIEHKTFADMEFTGNYGAGDFWHFYNQIDDTELVVKTCDLRYFESAFIEARDLPPDVEGAPVPVQPGA